MPEVFGDIREFNEVDGGSVIGIVSGALIGAAIGGPPGAMAGAIIGGVVGAGVGVVIYFISENAKEKAKLAQEREALVQEREQQEAELASKRAQQNTEFKNQSAKIKQEARALKAILEHAAVESQHAKEEKARAEAKAHEAEAKACENEKEKARIKACKEELEKQGKDINQKLIESKAIAASIDDKLINLGVQTTRVIKQAVDMLLKIPGISLIQVKEMVRENYPEDEIFFEDELRDPKTDDLLDDFVRAPDGCNYNRSTLVEMYKQAQEEKRAPVCFKNPLMSLPDPATLSIDPADHALRVKIQLLKKAGAPEAMGPSPTSLASVTQEFVFKTPTLLINKALIRSQADPLQEKTFLKTEGYFTFFIPRQKPLPATIVGQPHPLVPAVVVERRATVGAS